MDEVKIIESSNSKSFPSHPQNRNLQPDIIRPYSTHYKIQIHFTETRDWTMSSPTGNCLAPPKHCPELESEPNN
jgi:hypothetical protein